MKLNKLSKKKLIKMIYDLENSNWFLEIQIQYGQREYEIIKQEKKELYNTIQECNTDYMNQLDIITEKGKEIDHKDRLLKSLINS